MKASLTVAIAVALAFSSQIAGAVSPNPSELAESRKWAAAIFEGVRNADVPDSFLSFTYDGKPSAELLKTWELKRAARKLDENRTEHTLTYSDPKTGLVVRCVGIEYRDYPCVEWTLYFKNTGDKDTPILSDIQALDLQLERKPAAGGDKGEFLLHHNAGSHTQPSDYQPHQTVLGPGAEKIMAGAGGRPTGSDLSLLQSGTFARARA